MGISRDLASNPNGGFWDKHDLWVFSKQYYGMEKDAALDLDREVRNAVRNKLAAKGFSEEQIDAMVPASVSQMKAPPSKGVVSRADVSAYAKKYGISEDEAKKKVTEEGYTIQ